MAKEKTVLTPEQYQEQIDKLQAELNSAAEAYADLSKKYDALAMEKAGKKARVTYPKVKVEYATYELVKPNITFKGVRYTAKDVVGNSDLLKELVAIGASCLRKID